MQGANAQKLTALVQELKDPGVTESHESIRVGFANACLTGDAIKVENYLQQYPEFVNLPVPDEWHYHHIIRGGWQPVDSSLNPGVLNASGKSILRASPPAYGLHLAAGNGHGKIVALLLAANANIEAGDGDGDTAMTWATWCGRRDIMEQLLAAGADSSFADKVSVEDFVATKGDGTSLEYLKNKHNVA